MAAFFKSLKWKMIFTSLLYIAGGVLIIVHPMDIAIMSLYAIAGVLVLAGLISIIGYLFMDINIRLYRNDFVMGIISIICGIIVYLRQDFFLELIPTILGLIICASGLSKLQDGIDARKLGYEQGWIYLLLSAISLIFGIMVIMNVFYSISFLYTIVGIILIYCGASDLFSAFYLSKKIRQFNARMNNKTLDVETNEMKMPEPEMNYQEPEENVYPEQQQQTVQEPIDLTLQPDLSDLKEEEHPEEVPSENEEEHE